MSESRPHNESLLRDNRIDELCDRFERQWLAGETPRIEDVLSTAQGIDRAKLLRELVLVELEVRRARGESPTGFEYESRFPGNGTVIADAFESITTPVLRGQPEDVDTVNASLNSIDDTHIPGDPEMTKTFISGAKTSQPRSVTPSKRFGDYELLHEIARGGMGVVYKARQTKLNRVVALKMIKSGELAGDEEIQRFHTEAEAAAQLDHPHIVPIYEVGEQNGQHFFSMGFVEGQGLDVRLKDGPLSVRDAAELVKALAEAVQYAHDKGIVHRDLKPANVLLQRVESREPRIESRNDAARPLKHTINPQPSTLNPKITDFGLAKNIAAGDSGLTATGQVMGTPSYMPPEQARGDVANIGPPSDVYSLGAMLYATLTGRPPFQAASVMETLKQVLEREPVSPRQLNPSVDRDLETICLKCLAKEAGRRYDSAAALADDIGRFLAGRPIVARPLGRPARIWRWCRRNPSATTAMALLSLLAVGGPIIASNQMRLAEGFRREKDRADEKVAELKDALKRESAETKRADGNAGRAKRESLRARGAVNKYLTRVSASRELKARGLEGLRRSLLVIARDYYEEFVKDDPDDPDLQLERAQAYMRLASITSQTKSLKTAVGDYEQSRDIARKLVAGHPSQPKYRHLLAKTQLNLGSGYLASGRNREAVAEFRAAGQELERLLRADAGNRDVRSNLATVHEQLAEVFEKNGAMRESENAQRKALDILRELARQGDEDYSAQDQLAAGLSRLAAFYARRGRLSDAEPAYLEALKVQTQLAERFSTLPGYQTSLAMTRNNLGILYWTRNELDKALAQYDAVIALYRRLISEHPERHGYRNSLATVLGNQGSIYNGREEFAKAKAARTEGMQIDRDLIKRFPTVAKYRYGLVLNLNGLADNLMELKDVKSAVTYLQEAVSESQKLVNLEPANRSYKMLLAIITKQLGFAFKRSKDLKRAEPLYRKSYEIRQRLFDENPDDIDTAISLGKACFGMAMFYHDQEQQDASLPWYAKAVIPLRRSLKQQPRHGIARVWLEKCYWGRADAYEERKRWSEAIADWDLAIALGLKRSLYDFPVRRAVCLARNGAHAQAVAEGRRLVATTTHEKRHYDAARIYALASTAAGNDKSLSEVARKQQTEKYAKESVKMLELALKSGYFNLRARAEQFQKAKEFQPLATRPEFSRVFLSVSIRSGLKGLFSK